MLWSDKTVNNPDDLPAFPSLVRDIFDPKLAVNFTLNYKKLRTRQNPHWTTNTFHRPDDQLNRKRWALMSLGSTTRGGNVDVFRMQDGYGNTRNVQTCLATAGWNSSALPDYLDTYSLPCSFPGYPLAKLVDHLVFIPELQEL